MDQLQDKRKWKSGFSVAFLILLFSLASVLSINQYHYGLSDLTNTIPFLKSSVNPQLYPGDYFLAEKTYYYTYLWNTLGLLIKYLHFDIPILFFLLYFLSIYMTFLGLYLIAVTLFEDRKIAILSLFFLLFARELPAGGLTLHSDFVTIAVACPACLFSIYLFFKRKYVFSFLLLGIGFLIHPLSTVHLIAIIFLSSIFNLRNIGWKRFLAAITVFVISASPILIWKVLRSPASLSLFYVDPRWLELLRLRSPHHLFPFSWNKELFLQSGLLLFVFLMSCKYRPRQDYHRMVIVFTVTILAMCIAGTIFSEFLPLSIVLNLQLFRSFQWFVFLAVIYFSNYYFKEIQFGRNMFEKLLAAFLSICILYGAKGGGYVYVAFLGLSLFIIFYRLFFKREFLLSRYFILALVIIVFVLASAGYLFKRRGFYIENAQEKPWLEVQFWAKQNTALKDVFIVPPDIEGFRVESERTIYGCRKDGTLMNFNPSFGFEWFRRMKNLGYKKGGSLEEGFESLSQRDFIHLAKEVKKDGNKIFLVMLRERKPLDFKIVYENERFVVYEVNTP